MSEVEYKSESKLTKHTPYRGRVMGPVCFMRILGWKLTTLHRNRTVFVPFAVYVMSAISFRRPFDTLRSLSLSYQWHYMILWSIEQMFVSAFDDMLSMLYLHLTNVYHRNLYLWNTKYRMWFVQFETACKYVLLREIKVVQGCQNAMQWYGFLLRSRLGDCRLVVLV